MATVRMTGKMITISMADHVLSDQFMAAIVHPMADVEFQPYLNYGKHKRTFLWRRTWTKSKIPTSYKNNLQQSPLKGRLRRAATTVSATECSNPATTFAAWSLWGLGGFWGQRDLANRDAEEFAFALIATKDRTGDSDSSGGNTTLLNPKPRGVLNRVE